jgi:hypothetical protein
VPTFIGKKAHNAQGLWDAAGFTTQVTENGNGNFTINSQSMPAGTPRSCSATITVSE